MAREGTVQPSTSTACLPRGESQGVLETGSAGRAAAAAGVVAGGGPTGDGNVEEGDLLTMPPARGPRLRRGGSGHVLVPDGGYEDKGEGVGGRSEAVVRGQGHGLGSSSSGKGGGGSSECSEQNDAAIGARADLASDAQGLRVRAEETESDLRLKLDSDIESRPDQAGTAASQSELGRPPRPPHIAMPQGLAVQCDASTGETSSEGTPRA